MAPISGFNAKIQPGNVIRGFIPTQLQTSERDYETEQIRVNLRQAWNTKYNTQLLEAGKRPAVGPFRAVNNAGDLLGRKYYSCGGSNQVSQKRAGLYGLKGPMGTNKSACDGTGVPASTCNTKYVYDSSDYIRFRKQSAVSNNYTSKKNDTTYGGDQSNGSYVALRAVKRY